MQEKIQRRYSNKKKKIAEVIEYFMSVILLRGENNDLQDAFFDMYNLGTINTK